MFPGVLEKLLYGNDMLQRARILDQPMLPMQWFSFSKWLYSIQGSSLGYQYNCQPFQNTQRQCNLVKEPHLSCCSSPTILVIIFWNVTIFEYRSNSSQIKWNLISSIANLVYELLHELPNDLRLGILWN